MNNVVQHLCTNDSHVLRVELKHLMMILEVTNRQWNCVPLRIAKNWVIQRRIHVLAKYIHGDVSPHTDTDYENLLQKNSQTHEMHRYCRCLC